MVLVIYGMNHMHEKRCVSVSSSLSQIKEITYFSNNCIEQNKNKYVLAPFLFSFVENKKRGNKSKVFSHSAHKKWTVTPCMHLLKMWIT